MAISSEQRRENSRNNGRKSHGPTTPEGKDRSRRNALKHGLRAEALPLPNEDPAEVEARNKSWNDYYRPESPVAHHLVNQCVRATLLSDRCDTYQHEALTKQINEAQEKWDRQRADEVEALKATLEDDPARSVRHLKRTSQGCAWLIEQWERLMAIVRAGQDWDDDEMREALRMLGRRPDPGAQPRMPREVVISMVFEELRLLHEEMARLWKEIDGPDRAGAPDRALILLDPIEARLFLRYHAESRTSFHRSYRELVKVLQGEAERKVGFVAVPPNEDEYEASEGFESALAASPNEPSPAPVTAISPNEPGRTVASVSPNEPSRAAKADVPATSPNEPSRAAIPVTSPNEPSQSPARKDGGALRAPIGPDFGADDVLSWSVGVRSGPVAPGAALVA